MAIAPNLPAPRIAGALNPINGVLLLIATVASCWIATEWTALQFAFQPHLGPWLWVLRGFKVYPPQAWIRWMLVFNAYAPAIFTKAVFICFSGPLLAAALMMVVAVRKTRKVRVADAYGSAILRTEKDMEGSPLLSDKGVVIGALSDGRLLRDNSPEHVACIAPTRSGKGVGQVVPTLLTWPDSVIVHDMKGENCAITAAWRAKFSHVIYFNPTARTGSAHFNPLLEVRRDERQIGDVQNIAEQLVDPHGKGIQTHWERTALQLFLGVILHVLHAEPDKSLYGVAKFLSYPDRDFVDTLELMKRTRHDNGVAHERIAASAQAMLNKNEEERSGVLSTALAFLGLYSDPIIARNTADSDFRIADLMQGEYPLTLYIVVPDSDRLRVKPLTRLLLTLFLHRLTEQLNPKENRHRMLMLIDEFPQLGKLPVLSGALATAAGYDIKFMLIMQSKRQLDTADSYGRDNTIIESCRTRVFYTPQDPDTAQWISDAMGQKTEVRQQTTYTGSRLAPWLGHIMVADQESARPLMDAAEVCKMPSTDSIVLVAGESPLIAKRLKYYKDPEFRARASLPALNFSEKRPYPYRPPQRPNPWVDDAAPVAPPPKKPAGGGSVPPGATPSAGDFGGDLALSAAVSDTSLGEASAAPELTAELQVQQDLSAQDAQQQCRQGLDEMERLERKTHRHHRGIKL